VNAPNRFNIRFNNINIYCGSTHGSQKEPPESSASPSGIFDPLFDLSSPAANDSRAVQPGTASALGSICASVQYNSRTIPDAVSALVYPALLFPDSPSDAVPGRAVAGVSTSAGVWVWDNNHGNLVPGADVAAGGAPNYLAVWRIDSGVPHFDGSVNFLGVPGTTGSCGTGSGSGSEGYLAVKGKLFPAVWCAVITGFCGLPLAAFNAHWALRRLHVALDPSWENGGDGLHSAKVRLSIDQPHGWNLSLTLGQVQVVYTLPFHGDTFGPLRFPGRRTVVPALGLVDLPAIEVLHF
jgi:hypothetical protein